MSLLVPDSLSLLSTYLFHKLPNMSHGTLSARHVAQQNKRASESYPLAGVEIRADVTTTPSVEPTGSPEAVRSGAVPPISALIGGIVIAFVRFS